MSRTLLSLSALALLLSACASQPSKPVAQSNRLYNAPAQAYSLDLGSQAFRGDVRLRESCAPSGSTLDIVDNDGRFFRIDAINLLNNPALPLPEGADDAAVREQVLRYYTDRVYASSQVSNQTTVNSALGAVLYATMPMARPMVQTAPPRRGLFGRTANTPAVAAQNQNQTLGMLIGRRGNFAYVIQHLQNQLRPADMKAALGRVASDVRIPGHLVQAGLKQVDGTMDIDLKSSTPEQIAQWRKTAHCP